MSLLFRMAVAGAAILAVAVTSAKAELNPAAVAFKLPDKIEWKSPSSNAGVQQAVMVGDPSKPGLYVVLTKWQPGHMSRPHFHPNDRFTR